MDHPTGVSETEKKESAATTETPVQETSDLELVETREWRESLDYVLQHGGPERVARLLRELQVHARKAGVEIPFTANTPYINTIPADKQPPYPGNREIERRIKSLIRWNAMAMVVRANREESGIGGHISTYASAATLYEVGFNHFFRGREDGREGDIIYFQGHASPGIYARAFLEGRLTLEQVQNFRRELRPGGGLSSYPHPWLMPNFWEFPTRVDGPRPDHGHLSGALQPLPGGPRAQAALRRQGLGFLGDGETRRAGNAWAPSRWLRARSSTT